MAAVMVVGQNGDVNIWDHTYKQHIRTEGFGWIVYSLDHRGAQVVLLSLPSSFVAACFWLNGRVTSFGFGFDGKCITGITILYQYYPLYSSPIGTVVAVFKLFYRRWRRWSWCFFLHLLFVSFFFFLSFLSISHMRSAQPH